MMDELEDDKQAQADFDSGIEAETLPPVKPAVDGKAEAKIETKVEPKPQAKPTAEVKPAPKYVQITEEQYRRLEDSATETAAIKAQMSKAFGTMGDMQQVVKKLQAATPAGMSIEIPKDAFADMARDFPELAAHFQSGLEKILKPMRGTAPATTDERPNPDAIQKLIEAGVTARSRKNEEDALNDTYSNWREIVGPVDADGKPDPNNEFRKWLAAQPADYQSTINQTDSSQVIARAIGKFLQFKSSAKPVVPAPKVLARQNRIAAAVQPKGDGGQAAPSKSADDDFQAGFATG